MIAYAVLVNSPHFVIIIVNMLALVQNVR